MCVEVWAECVLLACVGLCVWLNTRTQSVCADVRCPLCTSPQSLSACTDPRSSSLETGVLSLQALFCACNPAYSLAVRRPPLPAAGGLWDSRANPLRLRAPNDLRRGKKEKNRAAPSADEIRMAELCPGPVMEESPTIRYFLPGLRVPRLTEVDTPYPGSRSRRSCRAEKRRRLGARAPLPSRVSTAAEGSASHVVLSEHRAIGRYRDEHSEREKLRPCPKRRQHPLPRSRRPRKKALL